MRTERQEENADELSYSISNSIKEGSDTQHDAPLALFGILIFAAAIIWSILSHACSN